MAKCYQTNGDGSIFEHDCDVPATFNRHTGRWQLAGADQGNPPLARMDGWIASEEIPDSIDSEVFAENFKASSVALAVQTKSFLSSMLTLPIEKGYEMGRRLKADPDLLAEFIKNPEEISKREVGIELPEGFRCYFVDEENLYHPPDGDALSQLSRGGDGRLWSRVEIRTAAGPGCYLFCVTCGMQSDV